MWERLEGREIRRRRASSARIAARRGITAPEVGDRPRPDLPEGTDLLPQIRHIVILMMENHSYDNYLGMLTDRGEGLPLGPDGTPDVVNYLPNGQAFPAHHLTSTTQVKNDPSQNWHSTHIQYADGRCDGFAAAVAKALPGADPAVPMGYWTEDDLPFYYGLARTFPLADHWFSSCLGPTFPNRRFLISGTAHGLIDDLPWDIIDYPQTGTIFDVLTKHRIAWVNYHNVRHYSVLLRRVFGGRGLTAARRLAQVGRWLPGMADRAVGNKSFTADLYPLGLGGCLRHLRKTPQFFADADAGTLPAVSIVDPDFGTYSEENPQDIAKGESFAAEVINRVMSGPAWSAHAADLALRRARRLLRSRPAAGGGGAGRRARAQLHPRPAGLAAHAAPPGVRRGLRPAEGHRRRPPRLHPLRFPGPGRHRLPVRPPRLRMRQDARPHLGAQAHRGEVEPAAAHPPGRRRGVTAGRPRPRRRAGLRQAPETAGAHAAAGAPGAVSRGGTGSGT